MLLFIFAIQLLIASAQLSTSSAPATLTRFNEFVQTLTTVVNGGRVVHSSGGAAGGVVSEGQGYGLFLGGATSLILGPSNPQFSSVVQTAYEFFLGWQKMCILSTSDGCQSPRYCVSGGQTYPCLPHWKFDDSLSSVQGTGSATDGDEDAILGMILLLKATQANKPTWWSTVNDWAYQSAKQFIDSETAVNGNWRIVKLGACWGGWDCNNPSYHAPAAYRLMQSFMAAYSAEGAGYSSKWTTVIDTTYAILLSNQNPNGLITNWYVPNSANPATQGTTACSGSGTPAAEYGSEASRGVWRVVLDYLWSGDARAAQFLQKIAPGVATCFNSKTDLLKGGIVQSILSGWLDNAFMYGPTLSSLVYPTSSIASQQSVVDAVGVKLASGSISDYYSGSWLALSTMVLNGDMLKIKAALSGSPSPVPVPKAPTPVPQAPVPVPQAPVPVPKAPTPVPQAPVPVPKAPTPVPQAPVPVPKAPTPVPQAPVPVPKAPTPVPQAPVPVPQSSVPAALGDGSCTGVIYGSPSDNDWFITVRGITSTFAAATVACNNGQSVSCSRIQWGDRFACYPQGSPCTSPRQVTFGSTTCLLDDSIVNANREGDSTSGSASGSFPAYSIALIVIGSVGLLLVAGTVVYLITTRSRPSEQV